MGLLDTSRLEDFTRAGGNNEVYLDDIIGGQPDDGFGPTSVSGFTDELDSLSRPKINLDTGASTDGLAEVTGVDIGAGADAGGKELNFFGRLNEGKLEGGDVLGLGLASTGLKMASAMSQIRDNEKAAMEQMQSEFDLAFGSREFDFRMNRARMNSQAINQMIQSVNNIQRQGSDIATQGLGRQTQTFMRNPVTGARV